MARVSVHGHCKMEISEFLSGLCWRAAHASCRPMAAAAAVRRRLLLSLLLKDNVVGFSRSGKESIFSLRLALELQTVLQNHLRKKKKEKHSEKRQPSFPFPCCKAGVTCTLTTERKRKKKENTEKVCQQPNSTKGLHHI